MNMDEGDERARRGSLSEVSETVGTEHEARTLMARRELLKAIGWTGGVLAVHAFMPREWSGPVVELTRLPAHAATSAACVNAVLTATRASNGHVTLAWTGATGAVDIYRKARGESAKKLVGIVDAGVSAYLDVTADPTVAYEYSLQGSCAALASVGAVK